MKKFTKYTLGLVMIFVVVGWLLVASQALVGTQVSLVPKNVPAPIAERVAFFVATSSKEATILFGGDVMLSRGIGQIMQRRNDFTHPFDLLEDITSKADLTIMNLEGPISSRGKIYGSIYSFRADPRAVQGLVFAGIDVVTLANNHSGDYGPEALLDTLTILKKNGIGVVGAGVTVAESKKAHIVKINGIKIAFIGATPLAPAWLTTHGSQPAVALLDEESIEEEIISARQQGADIVSVLLHWGNEYETMHTNEQGLFARRLIDKGANMIIGHHPHVVQEVEWYRGGVIAYSLGNFVFDQNFSTDTGRGLLLEVVIRGKEIARIKEIPIRFSKTYQPYAN